MDKLHSVGAGICAVEEEFTWHFQGNVLPQQSIEEMWQRKGWVEKNIKGKDL